MAVHTHWLPKAYEHCLPVVKSKSCLPDSVLARECGVSTSTISGIRKNEGIPKPPPSWVFEVDWSKRSDEIASKIGRKAAYVEKFRAVGRRAHELMLGAGAQPAEAQHG